MSKFRKIAKCPNCLPDVAGAIFRATYNDDFGPTDGPLNAWKCCNCGHMMPRRVNKPTQKITPSQQEVLNRLTRMGWVLETKFIGRNLWITGKAETHWLHGDTMFGTIGPRGNFKLERQVPLIPAKKVTDSIGLSVYFKVRPLPKTV